MWQLSSCAADRPSVASRFGIHLYVRADRSLATTEQDREQRPHVDTGGCQIRRSPLDARTAPGKSMFTMLRVPLWTVQSGASGPQTVRRRSATTQHRPTTVNGVSPAQEANRRYRPRSRHAVATLRLTGQLVRYKLLDTELRARSRLDRSGTEARLRADRVDFGVRPRITCVVDPIGTPIARIHGATRVLRG